MAKVNLQIISDLHLETPAAYDLFHINPKAPHLCLVGDIGYVNDDGFFSFLQVQLEAFSIVFLVLGNHEPYHLTWDEAKKKIKRFQDTIQQPSTGRTRGKLILLDQKRYDLSSDLTVLGCTLFSRVSESQTESVSFGLKDFYSINDWSVEKHQSAHLSDLTWLNEQVKSISSSEPHRKIIIMTHYCPTTNRQVIDLRHASSKISSGFMTDLKGEPCWENSAVKLWAFGHTHFNCDFQDDRTSKRIIANQRGYYFAQANGFDPEMVVEV
ncbi:hypothetical protein PENSTE_c001G02067 [Penicillium steckii]|uniref:Calcineurin-like phosphoesterase domain-containing protein n=1 Tax=Penicillium steckii TaxID=303698 RepID=A0A1V6U0S7_9EURO|nr:hypothetical protein PENSTE_c001G02067 [Penicillium steckii]